MNRLYFGDNLEVLDEHVDDGSVDLVYLDPPFNSNRNYSVIFGRNRAVDESAAQIQAFEDTWRWTHTTEVLLGQLSQTAPRRVAGTLSGFYTLLEESEALAYLVNMTPRLLQLHRVLKPTGSLYLHCDPTMSHYLKVLLDSIFGAENFRDEVSWQRHNARSVKQAIWPRLHDTLLFYGRSRIGTFFETRVPSGAMSEPHDIVTWTDGNRYRTKDLTGPGTRKGETGQPWRSVNPTGAGRHWRVGHTTLEQLDMEGRLYWQKNGMPRERAQDPYVPSERSVIVGDVWTDIPSINSGAAERLGYPTQKPLALLERIIQASSNPGDVVLDPFCGCGTTVDAAQRLGRQWIGIDITHLAIDVITKRLLHTYGGGVFGSIELSGIPKDLGGARALFDRSPLEFERWAVSMVNAEPNEKQVGDKGVDGVARFPLGTGKIGKLLVSVKGGKTINPSMVRDLSGTVEARKAQMGLLITLAPATKGVTDAINHGGVFAHPANGEQYPRLQHITVADLLAKKRPQVPPTFLPYIAAQKHTVTLEQTTLFAAG
ncbi:DNA methyltransferase [Mycobacterium hubeiense]|uniref:DNA methyltransferase n=1 Tax=Mycobacterium hubeiense TaxID=1867256 RepID=UPI000C7F737F|nr:DNA methyltransferase [Mycobacterium sp. QGD 101]